MKPKTSRLRLVEAVTVAAMLALSARPSLAPATGVVQGDAGPAAVPASSPAEAGIEGGEDFEWQAQSVRELLRRDLQEALRPAPARGGVPAARASQPADASAAQPRLVAMYGVGRRLMAEVQVGGRAFLYVRGQALPVGHAGDSAVYRLREMNGACVRLERGAQRHALCLRAMLGEARP